MLYPDDLKNHIKDLYRKSNIGMDFEQSNLYSEVEYYKLLKPVIDVINNNKDCTIDEMRNILFEKSNLEQITKDFIYKRKMAPGLVFTYGTRSLQEIIIVGNKQEVTLDKNGEFVPALQQMTEDTIFDLASITKVFTSLSILKLVQTGEISLDTKINDICP